MLKSLLAVTCFSLSISANAASIYSNFGPGDSFGGVPNFAVGSTISSLPNFSFVVGFQFTAAESALVDSIDVGVRAAVDSTANPTFGIYSDSGGSVGTLLEEISVSATSVSQVQTGLASGSTLLSAGTQYWMVASSDAAVSWGRSSPGVSLRNFITTNNLEGTFGYADGLAAAFRINSVPLPAAAWVFISAIGALVVAKRKQLKS